MSELADVIQAVSNGVVVAVWVVPRSSRDEITGLHAGALRVRVTAPPEQGRANAAAASLVAGMLGGREGVVLSGATSRRKRIFVAGIDVRHAVRTIGDLIGP
jgi:uncharacterized protein (TIGR00251 family)